MKFSLFVYALCLVTICYLHYRAFGEREAPSFPRSDSLRPKAPEGERKADLERIREKEEMTPAPISFTPTPVNNSTKEVETNAPSPTPKVWNWPSNETSVLPDFGTMETNRRDAVALVTRRVRLFLHRVSHSVQQAGFRQIHAVCIDYRKFDFSHFPAWWSINDEATRGGYAWKVISYFDVLLESKRLVVWSDGGNQLPRSLDKELERAHKYGLFTPYSGGVLQSWLHGSSAKFLQNHHMLRKVLLGKGMCTGGYLFIDYANDAVMRTVVFPLVECAYTKKCISPEGSSRKNHRQDQAILTALVQSARIEKSCIAIKSTGVRYHQECDSDESCRKSREFLKGLLRVH